MKRYTISSLQHLIKLISANPALLSLASLAPLVAVAEKAKAASKSCGCNAAQVYNDNKGQFELALTNLGNGDHLIVKKILNIDQICYYTRGATGGLQIKCI